MKTILRVIVTLSFCATAGCSSNYREMSSELGNYRPPSYFQSIADGTKAAASLSTEQDLSRDEGRRQLAGMRQKWRKVSGASGTADAFYRPEPERFRRLSTAARSDAGAAGVLKRGYTLETLEMLTLIRSPVIHAAEKRLQAELQAFSQVAELDAVLEQYTAFTEGLMTGVGPMKGKDSVRMKFPFPGVTALKGEVVDASVRAAAESLEIARRDALTNARKTYWNLLYVRKSQSITSETLSLFQRLESVAQTRYKAGNTSFQDVIKVTIESRILEEDLVTLTERTRNLESMLLDILDLPPDTAIGPPVKETPDRRLPALDRLHPLARDRRQELRRLRAQVGKMERMLELAETMILPPYSLGLSYYDDEAVLQAGSAAVKASFSDRTTAAVGGGLPKSPWFGTNDAWLKGTRSSLAALRADLRKTAAATDNQVRNTWFEMDRAVREEILYRETVVDLSKSALDVSTRGYESGTVSFADVIASYTNWLRVRLALARKISDIGVARAELEQAIGVSL
ncbi:TolC family protein [Desulfococcus sp.]|uniref:TolC family protein n=1 Tax=Desulfococcus sp. TaxID=2025834 RepID=UPI003D0A5F5D